MPQKEINIQNKKARPQEYHAPLHKKTRSFFTKSMRISGLIIFVYIFWHLFDYTFTRPSELNAMVGGEYLGLYGRVYNSFLNPVRSIFYIAAMVSISAHLVHGVQSVTQTFGFYHKTYTPLIKKSALAIAVLLAAGFSSIPVFVMLQGGL